MSAFMVSDDHIDYLVTAIRSHVVRYEASKAYYDHSQKVLDLTELSNQEIGKILVGTNLTSMMARYPSRLELDEMEAVENYNYRRWDGPASAAQTLKAIACYEYQCCEYDGWEQSAAHGLMRWLERRVINALPGMDEAAWEVNRKEDTE